MKSQTIEVPLRVGSRVAVLTDVSIGDGAFTASKVFEDTVEQYIPQTNKLVFEDSDIGYAEFESMINEHDSIQVIKE